jgi:hypothetical protein
MLGLVVVVGVGSLAVRRVARRIDGQEGGDGQFRRQVDDHPLIAFLWRGVMLGDHIRRLPGVRSEVEHSGIGPDTRSVQGQRWSTRRAPEG